MTGIWETEIKRNSSQPSGMGPTEDFTGNVRIEPLNQVTEPAGVGCASVTFEPNSQTAWHSHPLRQTLVVTAGYGQVQRRSGPAEEIQPEDVAWILLDE